jgi:hypothetical protein
MPLPKANREAAPEGCGKRLGIQYIPAMLGIFGVRRESTFFVSKEIPGRCEAPVPTRGLYIDHAGIPVERKT